MIQVAALTHGYNGPSARFRVRQYIPLLRDMGIEVHEAYTGAEAYEAYAHLAIKTGGPLKPPLSYLHTGLSLTLSLPGVLNSRRRQIVWMERGILPHRYSLEGLTGRPRVLDADDALWLISPDSPRAMRRVAQEAECLFAGNAAIANWFEPHARRVQIIPTAIDTDRFVPRPAQAAGDSRFVIGWTGTHFNLPYLHGLQSPLGRFLTRYPDTELLVICDQPPELPHLPPERVRFLRWTPHNEVTGVQEMDLGLMPLDDNEWTRAKCSFKMLQYMGCGLPVVVSPVGMNSDLLAQDRVGVGAVTADEWYDALEMFYNDRAQGRECGMAGRRLVEQRYSRAVVAELIGAAFKSLV